MFKYETIISPLDQFEIRNLFSIDTPLLGNINLSITNIGLYMTIATFLAFYFSILATNHAKIAPNKWSLTQETLYATIHSIVINQINNKKGQVYFPFMYALFIFILINNLIGMVKRCLSTTIFIFSCYTAIFFGNFAIIHYKNALNTYSTYTSTYKFASIFDTYFWRILPHRTNPSFPRRWTSNKNSYYLHPYYVTGFIDGEGCFTTSIFTNSRSLIGWQVKPIFKISLHKKDGKLLEAIQRTFGGGGKIYKNGQDALDYRVSSLKDLKVIINHLDQYPLLTKKLADYLLFKQSVDLIEKKEHLTMAGILKLVGIKASLNWGLSEKFKESFPNIIPAIRPEVQFTEMKDTNWLRGFVEAEGSFHLGFNVSKDKTKEYVTLRFTISQHSRDRILLESLVKFLDCGSIISHSNRNEVYFAVTVFSDIIHKIIPLFNEYPLIGNKKLDFLDFVKIAEIVKSKDHLTKEGLEKIKVINSNMNSRRVPMSA